MENVIDVRMTFKDSKSDIYTAAFSLSRLIYFNTVLPKIIGDPQLSLTPLGVWPVKTQSTAVLINNAKLSFES